MSPFRTPGERPALLDLRASLIAFVAIVALLAAAFLGFTQPQVVTTVPALEQPGGSLTP
jgi:hypothetical protein